MEKFLESNDPYILKIGIGIIEPLELSATISIKVYFRHRNTNHIARDRVISSLIELRRIRIQLDILKAKFNEIATQHGLTKIT